MIALIKMEIRRQLGRRGSAIGSTIVILLAGVSIIVLSLASGQATGPKIFEAGTGLLAMLVTICSILLGALAGSYDVDQGTMRYLVLTGVSRTQLVLLRVPALIASIVVVSLPGILMVLIAGLIAPAPAANASDLLDLFYAVWMSGILYGLLSLAIGMFLRSNGVAIAIALVVSLVGALIAALIADKVSETVGGLFFSEVTANVVSREAGTVISLPVAVLATVVWLVLLLGAAVLRVQRAEY